MNAALQSMLNRYTTETYEESYDALREVLQEIILNSLSKAGFFNEATFYGGTALRILYNLPRFSEDLDFSLFEVNPDFQIAPYKQAIVDGLKSYGFEIDIQMKEKSQKSAIASAFIKGNTLEHLLNIGITDDITSNIHRDQNVKIKLEVDTEPPLNFQTESKTLLRPTPYRINSMTKSCLFAGKMHALLCRSWVSRPKGRDWYDLVWYLSQDISVDLKHLEARLKQSCKWINESEQLSLPEKLKDKDIVDLLQKRIETVDFEKAKDNVRKFIKDKSELDIWDKDFFKEISNNIKFQS
ncbi:nucleotidyl transferase AbiEii/AbiGii toxin family protein [Arcobacter arenosus]|uniref:Nucleotidyl transferase AbiEii/AbiGii toxin family protein n=1 Tax=Arcobacter arenosus TaxID=2576037 RepID=A0A5R8XZ03_9BACT|nr:nucleotidyl transferase AbiEii/AbiGii toxin family protein [Arcobacter arenosus]TLP36827.1 nucleotidyl transferase AbiEii/AbiGii toxin family protein [Arcobacter arenosus]